MVGILGANTLSSGYDIDNSLRFNDDDSSYLHDTLGTPTNIDKFTISLWFKRGNTATGNTLISPYRGAVGNPFGFLGFTSSSEILQFHAYDDESTQVMGVSTNRAFRDPSAWYHVVCAVDTTQSTNTNRVKIYVNGVQQTSLSETSYPDQNKDLAWNQASSVHYVAKYQYTNGNYFDGYMADFYFIDGTQYAASDFGEFNDNNVWIPKEAKNNLTFGNNGYFLEFQNTSDAGEDSSGNSNNFTGSGMDSKDHVTDTPTNNFATLNSIFHGKGSTVLSEGNCKFVGHNGGSGKVPSTIGVTSGKWYVEFKVLNTHKLRTGITDDIGISNDADGVVNDGVDFGFNDGYIYTYLNGSNNDTGAGSSSSGVDVDNPSANDILGIALDADNDTVRFYVNNTAQGSEATDLQRASTSGAIHFFHVMDYSGSGDDETQVECNFGNPPFAISSGNADANGYGNFEYAPPSGFFALCTKNLAEHG